MQVHPEADGHGDPHGGGENRPGEIAAPRRVVIWGDVEDGRCPPDHDQEGDRNPEPCPRGGEGPAQANGVCDRHAAAEQTDSATALIRTLSHNRRSSRS